MRSVSVSSEVEQNPAAEYVDPRSAPTSHSFGRPPDEAYREAHNRRMVFWKAKCIEVQFFEYSNM